VPVKESTTIAGEKHTACRTPKKRAQGVQCSDMLCWLSISISSSRDS
jgi:hypothetical protein